MAGTGFEPVGYVGNKQFTGAMSKYWIATTATPKICYGQPVVLADTGTITGLATSPLAGTTRCAGIFLGCSYIDSFGNRQFSMRWDASFASVGAYGFVTDARDTIYRVKITNGSNVDATTTITSIGLNCAADVTSLEIGTSGRCGMGVSGFATTNTLGFRVVGLTNDSVSVDSTDKNPNFITSSSTFTHALVVLNTTTHYLDYPAGL